MRERVRAFRLRLAQVIAPAGADVHDPDETACPHDQAILEAAQFGRLRPDPQTPEHWLLDVTDLVGDLASARWLLVCGTEELRCEITRAGQERLAQLWGPKRRPPWSRGLERCAEHGGYDAKPGALLGCPSCAIERAIHNINTEPASWWRRWRVSRASR